MQIVPVVFGVVALALASISNAQNHTSSIQNSDPASGVVLNQTKTVGGQDFFHYFSAAWHDTPLSERHIVIVKEQPSARMGNHVWIEVGSQRIFQAILPPSRVEAKKVGQQAAVAVQETLINMEIEAATNKDDDLATDEI